MDQGGKIRTGNILRCLKGGAFDVTLASPAPADHLRYDIDIRAACDQFVHWPEQPVTHLRRLMAFADHLPVAAATDRSIVGEALILKALAACPDLVIVDFPHADVLMPPLPIDIASILFTHNVEAEIFERHAQRSRGFKRLAWIDQKRKMARFEQNSLGRYDTVIAVSSRDRDVLIKRYDLRRVEAIETGVDLDYFAMNPLEAAPDPESDGGILVFTATMNWPANVDGINFLLDEVFPRLMSVRPKTQAVIIGRNPPPSLIEKVKQRKLNVTLTGFVDDIRPYVAKANVYVIPLFVGSGTRIKAFEAMAMGRPVVSTSLGVEGLDVTDGQNFIRADTAEEFARAIITLMDDVKMRSRISTAARQLMEDRFSWFQVARHFEAICQQTLKHKQL